jgi:hypothetical protein
MELRTFRKVQMAPAQGALRKWSVLYWRARAEEARTIAETLADETSREIMLNIAKDYERMARRAEERQAAQRKSM